MILSVKELIKIFGFGVVLGYGPCLLTCLPIVLTYISAKGTNWKTGLKLTLVFSLSRLLAYCILAMVAVIAYRFVSNITGEKQIFLRTIAGIIIILIGTAYILEKNISIPLYKILHKYLVEKSNMSMAVLGLFIGFSPCGPMIGVLTYIACTAENIFSGIVYGFSFGLGTFISPILPAGAIAGLFSQNIKKLPNVYTAVRIICGLILIYFGIQLIT